MSGHRTRARRHLQPVSRSIYAEMPGEEKDTGPAMQVSCVLELRDWLPVPERNKHDCLDPARRGGGVSTIPTARAYIPRMATMQVSILRLSCKSTIIGSCVTWYINSVCPQSPRA